MNKEKLRNKVNILIDKISIEQRRVQERSIHEQLLGLIGERDSSVVLLYNALPDEVDVRETLLVCLKHGRVVLLPKVINETKMELYQISSWEDCIQGAYGILEPNPQKAHLRKGGPIDLAVIPGRVFSKERGRVGRGGGYYDRLLAMYPEIYKVGVGYTVQIVDELENDSRDVKMDRVISFR